MEDSQETVPVQTDNEVLIITEDIRSYIYEGAKWAKFLSIYGFIISAMTTLAAFSAPAMLSALKIMNNTGVLSAISPTALTGLYLVLALVYFYPSLMLYKYATAGKKAALYLDQESLAEAMSKMKSLFKFLGIILIITTVLYLLVIFIAVFAGIVSAGH